MIAMPQPDPMPIADYLDWEPQQDCRYEYVRGTVIAMPRGSTAHDDITRNLYRALSPHVRAQGCRINLADVKVEISSSTYYYPDLVVTCDPRDLSTQQLLRFPTLIIEVLSPDTEVRDRGKKFAHYRAIPTLQEYVLVESETMGVECYRRGEGGLWLYAPYTTGDRIPFERLGCSVAIADLYENIAGIEVR